MESLVQFNIVFAAVAQSVERRIGSAEVTGPIPVSSFVRNVGSLVFTGLPLFYVSIELVDSCRQYLSTTTMPLI